MPEPAPVMTATLLVKFFIGIAPFYNALLPETNGPVSGGVLFFLILLRSINI
jgi:hypothetical protein